MQDEHLTIHILVISEQPRALAQLVAALRAEYPVVCAQARADAELRLQAAPAVVLAEERVLAQWGPGLLENAFATQPATLWLLLTETAPARAFMPAIARGQIYYYLKMPPEPEELGLIVKRAVAYYQLTRAHQDLAAHCQALQEQQGAFCAKTPKQASYTDKMATLGQLVAGIAHEMNTPAGAINAAIGNVTQHLKAFGASLWEIEPAQMRREDFAQLLAIVAHIAAALDENPRKSSAETRAEQKRLLEMLSRQDLPNSRKLAKQIARLDIAAHADKLLGLAQHYDVEQLLTFLLHWSRIVNSIRDLKISIKVLIRIVQALKSYSYPTQEKPALADIHDSLAIALTILNNKLKHRIQVTYRPAALPPIWCYASELSQVWLNLIDNAIQAIPGEGEIRIETFHAATELGVRITDNGAGIPADIQERIFELNFTTKRQGEGSGLGLYLVRQIIAKHRGTITVASQPGQTTFEVRLPLASNPPPSLEAIKF